MKVFGIVGRKNFGKTHLVTRLLRLASRRGLRVSTIKHAHHSFDIDRPGKDSHLQREAGAHEVLVEGFEREVDLRLEVYRASCAPFLSFKSTTNSAPTGDTTNAASWLIWRVAS